MAKSTSSSDARKPFRPAKPYDGFPLFPHATGRWSKKICGKLRFYGRWGRVVNGELVPVDDVEQSAAQAKIEFDRCWPHHSQGREAPNPSAGDGCTIRHLCNAFLTSKLALLESGELTQFSVEEYRRTTDGIVAHFGKERLVDDLRPIDFESFRVKLAKGVSVVTLLSRINRARVVFKYAYDRRLIERPIDFGDSFNRPRPLALRKARQESGPKLFSRDEVLSILAALEGSAEKPVAIEQSASMLAMVLLGVQAGLGNSDLANLPIRAVDLLTGWLTYPRPKTGVERRIPLWPETRAALERAIAERPRPADAADAGLCFLTSRGTRFVRLQESKKSPGRFVTINSLSRRFEGLIEKLGIERRRGLSFYGLRHGFETYAGNGSSDQVAVDAIMGHVDESMAANYRQNISDARLVAVVQAVRAWLWPDRPAMDSPAGLTSARI